MPTPNSSMLQRTLPLAVVDQVHHLLVQMKQERGDAAFLLTEKALLPVGGRTVAEVERFTLLLSQPFSALLLVQTAPEDASQTQALVHPHSQVQLTFETAAIAAFLDQLALLQGHNATAIETLQQSRHFLQPNDAIAQSEFTLRLLEVLATSSPDNRLDIVSGNPYPASSVCQPFQDALEQQIEQSLLLSQVTNQIRQSLDLTVILKTAVEQVRRYLQVDRLVIYQFEPEPYPASSQNGQNHAVETVPMPATGYITYESRASEEISSVLYLSEENCFDHSNSLNIEKYCKGNILAIDDVESAYPLFPCLLQFLQQAQVRAKLIAPILIRERLWGLLIAHQCFEPRHWSEREQKFLQQIAAHLAIAIHQARLYAQLRHQKQTLEQRVLERTHDLHDALLAAQAADRAKSEFLATMSHELRTPLTYVIGMSSTLLRWSFGELNQRQRSYLQTIHDSGERLLELINDILDLSQIEAGRTVLDVREFSLSGLASQSLEAVRESALHNGVSLNLDISTRPEQDTFVADPRRVRQILANLLSNAVKFTPSGGTVTLKVRAEANATIFQVEDTGIGIPEEQRSFLFEKFRQLDAARHRSYEGTGIGLALTKQLVELHGGWLGVESQVGVGSVFTVRIPSQRSKLSATEQAATPPESLFSSRRVILFEQDEESANVVCDMLTAARHQIVWMIDGSAVTEQVELMDPSLIILSMTLPGTDGYNTIRTLRQSPSTQSMKILALVPDLSDERMQRCLEAGADDCVAKPIQPDDLLHKINALMYSPASC